MALKMCIGGVQRRPQQARAQQHEHPPDFANTYGHHMPGVAYDEPEDDWDGEPEMRRRRRRRSRYEGGDTMHDGHQRPMGFISPSNTEYESQNNVESLQRMRSEMRALMDDYNEMRAHLGSMKEQMGSVMTAFDASLKPVLNKLDGAAPELIESAVQVLKQPPHTWGEYLSKKDYAGILNMEFGELKKALDAKKPASALKKEMTHTLAAMLKMLA